MKTLFLLEDDDIIEPTDWIRPITIIGDSINGFSTYSGRPMNNVRWVQFQDIFGKVHFGKTVRQLKEMATQYVHAPNRSETFEIMRGEMPAAHVWDWQLARERGY